MKQRSILVIILTTALKLLVVTLIVNLFASARR